MQINIRTNLKPLQRQARLTQKQTLFATSGALTSVAYRGMRFNRIKIKKDLHNPKARTVKSIRYKRATNRRLASAIYVVDFSFRWLKWSMYGGLQRFRPRRFVPVPALRNKAGNISPAKLKALINDPDVISVGARKNVMIRPHKRGRGRALLGFWITQAMYKTRFFFFKHGEHIVNKWLVKEWNTKVRNEIRRIEARAFKG